MSRRIVALLASLAVLLPVPGLAQQPPDAAQPQQQPGIAGPVRLIPAGPDAAIRINGSYPPNPEVCPARQPQDLHAAYSGTLEIGRRAGGELYLVAELTFPEYLSGIAEVPRDWPMEALKAQVVAARTYAIRNLGPSGALAEELDYDLCSTDACQVFRGLNVKNGAWGERWQQAVQETAGEILELQGRPASTVYFSTSNGQTYSNADVFGSAPLPYLQPVTEEHDTESPVSHWEVRMPLEDLTSTLGLGGWWNGPTIERVEQQGETVVVSGGGQSVSMSLAELRGRLNAQAVCLTPKRYPTNNYPQVIPSVWMTVSQDGNEMVATGRGWGHGAGMVQWGAKGKADLGMNYREILSFYYGGLEPVTRQDPGRIRVSLATNLQEITVERIGEVRVEGAEVPEGTFRITGGDALSVQPAPPIAPRLELTRVAPPGAIGPDGTAAFDFELSSPAKVQLSYQGPEGQEELTDPRPLDRGEQTYQWAVAEDLTEPGTYEVHLVADDGVDRVTSRPLTLSIASAPSPSPEPSPTLQAASEEFSPLLPIGLGIGSIVLVVGLAILGIYVRRQPPGRRSIE